MSEIIESLTQAPEGLVAVFGLVDETGHEVGGALQPDRCVVEREPDLGQEHHRPGCEVEQAAV
mgnify:CR=1 FL=1